MSQTFQRTIEDFTCEHCGKKVKGNGYTNHCPFCLWSKHVDNSPGDRKSDCGGMMRPVSIEYQAQEYIIRHKCLKCGVEKKNRSVEGDDVEVLIKISKDNSN